MRVVHLRASNFYGGPERQLHFHARLALPSRHRLTIATFSTDGGRPEFLTPMETDGIDCTVFSSRSSYDPAVVRAVRDYLQNERVDLLCTHDYRSAVLGGWATRGSGTRWIAFSRGFTSDDFKVRLYHAIDKLVVRFADHVVAVSHSQKRKLERLLVPSRRISVVPNAIDAAFFAGVGTVDLRGRFGFDDDAVVVIAGGRFSREKGQIHLVRAAHIAITREPRLRFLLFGHGPDLERVRAEVRSLGLDEHVLCPGFERELLPCVRSADLLVNPSLSEGLPNIVLEAMALGVPVLATDVGGHPEIIEDGRTGRLVPPGRPSALADAVVEIASDPVLASGFAESGRRFVLDACTFELQFDQLDVLYEREGRA